MTLLAFRWRNFRSFRDTGLVELRPITLFLGANASGKTSVLAPVLLLHQTNESRDAMLALKTKGSVFNAGAFEDFVHCHDTDTHVTFELCFLRAPDPGAAAKEAVPSEPPGQLALEYIVDPKEGTPRLLRFTIRDTIGREMLSRSLREDGSYDLTGIDLPIKGPGIEWTRAILATLPEGFLFTPQSVFHEYYKRQRAERGQALPAPDTHATPEPQHQLYLSMLSVVTTEVADLLGNVTYIGPLRDRPKRIYEVGGETPFSVGAGGQYAPEILFRNRGSDLEDNVNRWITRFEFGKRIECKKLAAGVFSLLLHRAKRGTKVNVADTGFGLSQVLPLIVQGFYGDQDAVLIAEQPEIHLNPRLQTTLADLFVAASNRGVRVVVETHSEHLVLRLRRLIAEGEVSSENVALYFVERIGNESHVRRIPIDRTGHIDSEEWPKGFFEETLSESLGLASAQMRFAPHDH